MNFIKQIVVFFLLPLFIFSSCKKDKTLTDSSAKLGFSTNQITFDTVFATVGSVTRVFNIYNHHNQPLNISKIFLGGGSSSQYRINVDGVSGSVINSTQILPNDSLYVFVQVTINPTNQNSPLLVEDSITFVTNGNNQIVKLLAIGQDVYLQKPDHFPTNGFPPYSIIGSGTGNCPTTNWSSDKPHLIFGYAVVDSCCTLNMSMGTRVYLNNGAVLYVYKDGTLNINGTFGNEVTIQGARLDAAYRELPSQWGKIWLTQGSNNTTINWAIIKNGGIGIEVDSSNNPGPGLLLTNTIIRNMGAAALFAQTGTVISYNTVFANCGEFAADLSIGGKYRFYQCTFADYWNSNPNNLNSTGSNSRTTPLLFMNNYYTATTGVTYVRPMDSAYFYNCIFYGDLANEIGFDTAAVANECYYYFDHCIMRTTLNASSPYHYFHCYPNTDPLFNNVNGNNYNLTINSPAINAGNPTIIISPDLNNATRPTGTNPDLGAYQYTH